MTEPVLLSVLDRPTIDIRNDCAPVDAPYSLTGDHATIRDDCALVTTRQADYVDDAGRLCQPMALTPQLYTAPLPYNFILALGPLTPGGPLVLNEPAVQRLRAFQTPQPLAEAVDYTLAAHNLLLPIDYSLTLPPARPETLTAWLHLTNACNLACPYCYVRKSSAHMDEATGRQVIDSIFNSAQSNGFSGVTLKYAGGEAALQFKLMQRLHQYAQQLARRTSIALQAVVLSNGTVWTPRMAAWLGAQDVKLMISLDGVGAVHDTQRPTVGGGGTFARIERTVDHILLPAGIRPHIAITVTGLNAAGVADAVRWAIGRDLSFGLNLYRTHAYAAGYPELQFEEQQIISGMRRAYQVIEANLPTQPFLNGLVDKVRAEAHRHPCGVGQNYLVFTHTGKIAQCQMHLADNPARNVTDDPLQTVKKGRVPIIGVEAKADCRDCVWRYRCAGGCPLETYRVSGRFNVKSPNCNIYTTLFPEALHLEGLRLLKRAGYPI